MFVKSFLFYLSKQVGPIINLHLMVQPADQSKI